MSSYQCARLSQKMIFSGHMPGSSSSVPAGITAKFLSSETRGTGDPHSAQKFRPKTFADSSLKSRIRSSPWVQLKLSGVVKILLACAEPVAFLHLEQWQTKKELNGPRSSNFTFPQRQLPLITSLIGRFSTVNNGVVARPGRPHLRSSPPIPSACLPGICS